MLVVLVVLVVLVAHLVGVGFVVGCHLCARGVRGVMATPCGRVVERKCRDVQELVVVAHHSQKNYFAGKAQHYDSMKLVVVGVGRTR